jgi:hypothetical protein
MCISGKGTSDKLKAADTRLTSSQTNNNRAQEEDPYSIVIPTFREERPRSLDVTSLTQSELAKLKTEDPFMYFSIPAVRIAELSGNDVDAPLAGTVSRMQRITAEAYPDIVVEDIVNDANLMERIVQEVQNEMEQERQQEAQEDDEEEEEDGADDEMIQRYFNLLSENF